MSKATMIGKITCVDGKNEELEAVFARMVTATNEEAGTEVYSYHRGDGNDYWFFAVMSSQEAAKAHGQNDAMKAAMADVGGLMEGPPEISMATPLTAKGLDV